MPAQESVIPWPFRHRTEAVLVYCSQDKIDRRRRIVICRIGTLRLGSEQLLPTASWISVLAPRPFHQRRKPTRPLSHGDSPRPRAWPTTRGLRVQKQATGRHSPSAKPTEESQERLTFHQPDVIFPLEHFGQLICDELYRIRLIK